MDTLDLLELVKKGEDSTQQFKERVERVDSMAAEICAFSNSDGGTIIIGVSNDGEIIGLTREEVDQLNQYISNACSQNIDPPVSVFTENIPYGDKVVVVIKVPRGINKYYTANGRDIWVKVGADKRRARREEIQRLLQESGHLYADEIPIEYTSIKDLELGLFQEFYERRVGEPFQNLDVPLETILNNMKLMNSANLTLSGLLMFGKKPEEKKPQFIIKAVSFVGNSVDVSHYKDSRDITGNIAQLYQSAKLFLKNNLRMLQKKQNFNSVGILEIPEEALDEALINALLHRNYFISSNIRLFIFDNRVEIISPGSLPNTATVESIKLGIHIERNPILVSLIKDIKEIPYRGIGTGVQRIIRTCKEAGVRVEFMDEKQTEQFKVTFYR